MYLLIAIGLVLINAVMKPLSDGLIDTSMWVAKMLVPSDSEDNEATKQYIKFNQAALMDGWLSSIPFIGSLLFFSSVILGFCFKWWGGFLVFFIAVVLGTLAKLLWTRPVAYYLSLLLHKMVNRVADYRVKGDTERLEAAETYCQDLQNFIAIYSNSRLKPPTEKELKNISYGEPYEWLAHEGEVKP